MNKIVEVKSLVKSYKDVKAVKGIDFYVEEGKLFAFLGPNGAGKSTTIDMICTYLKPDSGEIIVDGCRVGKNDDEIRRRIGIVFQDSVLDPILTVRENITLRGSFYGLKGKKLAEAVENACKIVSITEFMDRPYGKLSGGQRRRADIARALVNTPKILFLDEPTTGLDPQTRQNVWETIAKLQKENNMTVFLTTHYMEEASEADYVIVIDDGKVSAKGTPAQLKETYAKNTLRIVPENSKRLAEYFNSNKIEFTTTADVFVVTIESTVDALKIVDSIRDNIESIEIVKGTMDDAFIGITGKEIRV
ncbi:MAG: ABC transporter ATP-binding protein [Clostridia bacterium]|nr:ABC transporter ATP-binding protein [Clostridia bacterium]MEE1125287.1 ABC transporter ATP-binding protein [Acutalibacteraceae bacterium]